MPTHLAAEIAHLAIELRTSAHLAAELRISSKISKISKISEISEVSEQLEQLRSPEPRQATREPPQPPPWRAARRKPPRECRSVARARTNTEGLLPRGAEAGGAQRTHEGRDVQLGDGPDICICMVCAAGLLEDDTYMHGICTVYLHVKCVVSAWHMHGIYMHTWRAEASRRLWRRQSGRGRALAAGPSCDAASWRAAAPAIVRDSAHELNAPDE